MLWSILRARHLCGLKFRRQHPIGPYFAEFACPEKMLVVEIDGGYHDAVIDRDIQREQHLHQLRWTVLRFSDKDVEHDAENVARAIAKTLGIPYKFQQRHPTGSGMMNKNMKKKHSR